MRQYDKLKEQLRLSRPAHHDCPEPDPSSPDYARLWQDPPRARPYAECHPDQDEAPSDASLQSDNDSEKTNPIAGSSSTCPEQSRVPAIPAEQLPSLNRVNTCESAPDDFPQNEPDSCGNTELNPALTRPYETPAESPSPDSAAQVSANGG
jgi:hypothetical protein